MREILFRGKKVYNGEWAYGLYVLFGGKSIIMQSDTTELRPSEIFGLNELYEYPVIHEVGPDTVGQFTGLLDKNGNKIFEGDILKDEFNNLWLVTYELGAFCISNGHSGGNMFEQYADDIQIGVVIGNKWDNPELLNL